MCMVLDLQMMEDKMDMMMNAIRGQVSTNLDELVHLTNSPESSKTCKNTFERLDPQITT